MFFQKFWTEVASEKNLNQNLFFSFSFPFSFSQIWNHVSCFFFWMCYWKIWLWEKLKSWKKPEWETLLFISRNSWFFLLVRKLFVSSFFFFVSLKGQKLIIKGRKTKVKFCIKQKTNCLRLLRPQWFGVWFKIIFLRDDWKMIMEREKQKF